MISDHSAKACRYLNGSREVGNMTCIPLERSSKMIMVDIEFVSFDERGAEISWIKVSTGEQTGGTSWDTPKGHIPKSPGGECFAPFGFPRVLAHSLEDALISETCALEESASLHVYVRLQATRERQRPTESGAQTYQM